MQQQQAVQALSRHAVGLSARSSRPGGAPEYSTVDDDADAIGSA
jgi:Arc/MetJ family transcription regulator